MADRLSPLQNRVTPEGDIVATPARGTMMGNRGGPMHGADQRLGRRRWVSRQWIACRLEFNLRHREVMAPGRYTELFFLDEATALAVGHRPCFECRRADFLAFATLWAKVFRLEGRATAGEMDHRLHAERVDPGGRKVTFHARIGTLPDGALVRHDGRPWLIHDDRLMRWTPAGYDSVLARLAELPVEVLTPRSIVAVLSAGYSPSLHPTATDPIARPTS